MKRFLVHEFPSLEGSPSSPNSLTSKLSAMIDSSTVTRVRVEGINHETGEYRVVLQGSLDLEHTPW